MTHTRLVVEPKSLLVLLCISTMIVVGLSSFAPLPGQAHTNQNAAQEVQLSGSVQLKPIHTTAPTEQGVKLVGNIVVRAVYGVSNEKRQPRDIVFLLDGSNAMNWTSSGKGTYTPGVSDPTLAQYVTNGDELNCVALLAKPQGCQPTEAYKDYKQRQIYLAKQGIKRFLDIEQWGPEDRAAVVTFNGGNADPSMLTAVYPQEGLSSDIHALGDELITEAASTHPGSSDTKALYTTSGGSPGALGFKRAQQVFDAGASSGSSERRARTLVMLTDSVMNVYLNGQQNPDGTIKANYDPTNRHALPVNQAITQSNVIKNDVNSQRAKIYILALGSAFNKSGLDQMASDNIPPYLTTVGSQAAMNRVIEDLAVNLISPIVSSCDSELEPDQVPAADRTYRYTSGGYTHEIDPATGQPSLGKVTVKLAGALVATANISTDGTFAIPELQPGADYTLSFNNPNDGQPVFYQGLDQPVPQLRNYSITTNGSQEVSVHINDASFGTTQFVYPDNSPVLLLLNGPGVCPQVTANASRSHDPAPQQQIMGVRISSDVGEPDVCQVVEEDAVVPPADKMFRLENTTYITETTSGGQPRLGVVTVRNAEDSLLLTPI